jgi:hypothetical protein
LLLFCWQGAVSQDLSVPANIYYDNSAVDEAVMQIMKYGIPVALVFGTLAFLLWKKMTATGFVPVPTRE